MSVLDDGRRIMVGSRNANATPVPSLFLDAYILAADESGGIQLLKTWDIGPCDEWVSVQPSGDGGYYLVGNTGASLGAGSVFGDIIVAKIDGSASELWQRVLESNAPASATSLSVNLDGTFAVVGYESTGTLLIKIDATGSELWRRRFEQFSPRRVLATGDNGYVIAGNTPGASFRVIKTDSEGDVQWLYDESATNTFDLSFSEGADIVETRDGGFAVACSAVDEAVGQQLLVVKLDSSGNVVWGAFAPGSPQTYAVGIGEAADGTLVAAGESFAYHPVFDVIRCYGFYGARFSADGAVLWYARLGELIGSGSAMSVSIEGQLVFSAFDYYSTKQIYTLTTDAGG